MKRILPFAIASMLFLTVSVGWGQASLTAGQAMPTLLLPDAHDNEYTVPYSGVRHVIFGADMEANTLMERAFGTLDKGAFTASGLVYVADISGMPGLVARLFAIPELRDYPFRVLLARNADAVAFFPREEGALTLLALSPGGNVETIRFARNVDALTALVDP